MGKKSIMSYNEQTSCPGGGICISRGLLNSLFINDIPYVSKGEFLLIAIKWCGSELNT